MFKVSLGVCSHRWLSMPTFKTAWMLQQCPDPEITPIFQEGDALISRSRNRVATHFLKNTDHDLLAFMDDDIEIDTLDFTRMFHECYTNRYPILGAPYVLKDHTKGGFAFLPKEEIGEILMGKGGSVRPVKRVSTGCMVIRREVLETLVKKEKVHFCRQGYYTFFQHREVMDNGEWDDASEDWWFCKNALDCGFQVFLDSRPKTSHWGMFPYNFDFVKLNGNFKKNESVNFSYGSSSIPPATTGEGSCGTLKQKEKDNGQ